MQLDDMDQGNAPHMACERIGQKAKNFFGVGSLVGHHYVDVRTQGPSDKTSSSLDTEKRERTNVSPTNPDQQILDLKGYKCPLPVLKARKAMYGAPAGQQFLVYVTDPKAPIDFAEFCKVTGYTLVDSQATDYGHQLEIHI